MFEASRNEVKSLMAYEDPSRDLIIQEGRNVMTIDKGTWWEREREKKKHEVSGTKVKTRLGIEKDCTYFSLIFTLRQSALCFLALIFSPATPVYKKFLRTYEDWKDRANGCETREIWWKFVTSSVMKWNSSVILYFLHVWFDE